MNQSNKAHLFLAFISILVIIGIDDINAKPSQLDIERNRIDGGNDSINIIAKGESKVLVFRDNSGNTHVLAIELVKQIEKKHPEFFDKAAKTMSGQETYLVEELALANYVFKKGQYSLSAELYEAIIGKFSKDDIGYNAVEGLTTASYYGSGRHIQGLKFICRQYASRPNWSYRFRHDIHAHLRSLTVKFGHDYARKVLEKIREDKRCRRKDFSEVWIPIHLSDMRGLETGIPYGKTEYGFSSEKDKAFAQRLIREEKHGFLDYIHFINGDFSTVIKQFPESYLTDLSLLGMGRKLNSIGVLEQFLDKYKNSKHIKYALKIILKLANKDDDKEKIAEILTNYDHVIFQDDESLPIKTWSGNELHTLIAFQKNCINYTKYFENMNFRTFKESLMRFDKSFNHSFGANYNVPQYLTGIERWGNSCVISNNINSGTIGKMLEILQTADQFVSDGNLNGIFEFAQRVKKCGDIRVFLDKRSLTKQEQNVCNTLSAFFGQSIRYHNVAASYFEYLYDYNDQKFHKALFLAALSHKHVGEFGNFLAKMHRYVRDHPNKELTDDALTEIGWYYLVVKQEPDKSDEYFKKVINKYKNTNAYDNALNWLVISKRNQGDYVQALQYASKLAVYISSKRLIMKISGRLKKLRLVSQNFDINRAKISVGTFWEGVWGVRRSIAIVQRSSLVNSSPFRKGVIIYKLNGKPINNSDDFYTKLIEIVNNRHTRVLIEYWYWNIPVLPRKPSWQTESERIHVKDFGWTN